MKSSLTMKYFDSHCHFETDDRAAIAAQLRRAKNVGVGRILAVGGSVSLSANAALACSVAAELGDETPLVDCAFGIDRDQVAISEADMALCAAPPNAPSPVAVGEIGLDYHYSPETRDRQRELFAAQLDGAKRRNLPVVIHTREAAEDTIAILREVPSRGVIHCFTGAWHEARAYLDLGFFVSISGIVTFRSAENVREVARLIPDDRILIETDAPYLAPVPMRGNANEPAFVSHTCAFLAALRETDEEAFAALTYANAERLVGR